MLRDTGSVSAVGAILVLGVAEKLGARRDEMLARAGLPVEQIQNPEGHIPLSLHHALWEEALRSSGDRSLPLRVAEACEPGTFHVLGYACMTAPSVAGAMDRLVRFLSLFLQGETVTLEHRDGNAHLVLHQTAPRRVGRALSAESTLAKIVVTVRILIGDKPWSPAWVSFAHEAPDDTAPHETLFGCPVRFGADRTEIVIPPAMLEIPLAKADPTLSAFFEKHAEEILARVGAQTGSATRVRRAVTEAIHAGDISETTVARRLGWSERTLRRRLGEEGTNFRTVLDAVRQELAQSWLVESRMSIGEVAFLLGFSEASNFHRAFKRWTGHTPDEFRRTQRASA